MKILLPLLFLGLFFNTTSARELDGDKLVADTTRARADAAGMAWFDPREKPFRVSGFPWIKEDKVFRRLPLAPDWELREPVHQLANNTAGGQVHFQSDSPKIMVRVTLTNSSNMDHMPATGQSGVDLYVGAPGKQRYCSTSRISPDALDYTVTMFRGSKANRNFTLNFPLYNGVKSIEIGVAAGSSVTPPPPFRESGVIVVYGTSITQGGCAARPGMAYTNILSRKLNLEFVNLGFSGNGRGEPALAQLINQIQNKKMIVLDYEANANAGIRETLGPFIEILRDNDRNIPILVISKIRFAAHYHDEGRRKEARDLAQFQRDLVKSKQTAGDANIYFLDGDSLLGESADECTVDGVHPTDLGFMKLAESIEPVMKRILNETM